MSTSDDREQIFVGRAALIGNESAYVNECLRSTWIGAGGPFVERFEKQFAERAGCEVALATNSGTSALHLALLAIGIKPGDEVIVPALSYVASANVVAYCGAKPVFVDSIRPSLALDPRCVEAAITPATKAIMPVHLYGYPADMNALMSIAERHGLLIVEDAAEAIGSTYRGKAVGTFGACGAFSFFGNKLITTGQGGMVTTSDRTLAERARVFREQGTDPQRRYWSSVIGFNYRMTNIEAAIGCAQLERFEDHLQARTAVARWYSDRLADLDDVLIVPLVTDDVVHSHWMFVVEFRDDAGIDRDAIISALAASKIETRPGFFPIYTMPPYRDLQLSTPVADTAGRNTLCLPTHALLTERDVDRVVEELRTAVRRQ